VAVRKDREPESIFTLTAFVQSPNRRESGANLDARKDPETAVQSDWPAINRAFSA